MKVKKRLIFFVILSLLLHLLLFFFLKDIPTTSSIKNFEEKKQSQVVWVEPQQIVDIDQPEHEQKPKQAQKVGNYNSSTPKEQVATTPKGSNTVIPDLIRDPSSKKNEVKTKKAQNNSSPDLSLKPSDFAINTKPKPKDESKFSNPNTEFKSLDSGLAYGRAGAMFNQEYLPDYQIGGKTYLNVLKLQEVSYFVKMKRILKLRWNPIPSVRNYLISHSKYPDKIECVVGVELGSDGKLEKIFPIKNSGIPGFDQEVLKTFKDSSPFAKPPEQYLKEGQLNMSWTFTVYL